MKIEKRTYFVDADGIPREEIITYQKAGTGGVLEDDPRLVEVEGEEGLWFFLSAQNYSRALMELEDGKVKILSDDYWKGHKAEPRKGFTEVSKEDFDRETERAIVRAIDSRFEIKGK